MQRKKLIAVWIVMFIALLECVLGSVHRLILENDIREIIEVDSFGFKKGGEIHLNITNFSLQVNAVNTLSNKLQKHEYLGILIKRSFNRDATSYANEHADQCLIDPITYQSSAHSIFLLLNNTRSSNGSFISVRNGASMTNAVVTPLTIRGSHSVRISFRSPKNEGQYGISFHNCANFIHGNQRSSISARIDLVDFNVVNLGESDEFRDYLSAGDAPLPTMYMTFSGIFFIAMCVWLYGLRKNKEKLLRLHWLMFVVILVKSLSVLVHGIRYYLLRKGGSMNPNFDILYITVRFAKGALFFMTVLLIGSGWAFVKPFLSDKDKKIIMVMVPLQIIANIASAVVDETESGSASFSSWFFVFRAVDLICLCSILLPTVWSIRHLQEAKTSGKDINLRKLKLFRQFYIMVIFYVYFSRVLVIMVRGALSFRYTWIAEFALELATLLFFIALGKIFSPGPENPYLSLSAHDPEDNISDNGEAIPMDDLY